MENNSLNFFKKLIETISPSGSEQEAVYLWEKEVKKFAQKVDIDINGNGIAVLNEGKNPKIMLASHIDEVGFMLKYIDNEGYIYFSSIGGLDAHIIPGQRIKIKTKKGEILGVIGKKPVHLLEEEEKKKICKIEDLWIDIGSKDGKETKSKVDIGDIAVINAGFDILNSDRVVGRGFDNKAGVFVVTEVLKKLSKNKFAASLYGVVTVQEEIGLRGAKTSAYGISPDIGIAIDVTFASDFPTMDKRKTGDIKIGSGPVIAKGPNINSKIFDLLVYTAKKENIPYQIEAIPGGTRTDANVIQLTKAGVATGLVSIPLRYMHTPIEVISLGDLENTSRLIQEFILKINKYV
jgi:tetrahedral aminopeptidase